MVLTDTQKKLVALFLREKLQLIFSDSQELETIYDMLFDDVVSDIEDTADWSTLTIEGNEVVNSDVEIAIARTLYNKLVTLVRYL